MWSSSPETTPMAAPTPGLAGGLRGGGRRRRGAVLGGGGEDAGGFSFGRRDRTPGASRAAKRRRTLGEAGGREEARRELTPIRTRAPSPERSRVDAGSFGGGSSARSTPSVPRGAADLPFEAEMDEVVAKLPAPSVLARVPSREEQHRVFVLMWGLRKAVLQYKARVGRPVEDLCGFRGSSTSGFLTAVRRLSRALPEVDQALTLSDAGVSLVDAMQRTLRSTRESRRRRGRGGGSGRRVGGCCS